MSKKVAESRYLVPAPAVTPVTSVTILPAPAPTRKRLKAEEEPSIKVGEYRVTPGPLAKPDKKVVRFIETTGSRFFDADQVAFTAKRRPVSRRDIRITPKMPRLR